MFQIFSLPQFYPVPTALVSNWSFVTFEPAVERED